MSYPFFNRLAEKLALSLILEASAYPKPGNVHRLSERADLHYEDFLITGIVSLKYFLQGLERGYRGWGRRVFGDLIYGTLRELSELGIGNTCLGSMLLLTPLSLALGYCARSGVISIDCLMNSVRSIVGSTTVEDSIYFYRAIRLAKPSYLKPADVTGDYVNVWDDDFERKLLEKNHRLVDVLEYSSKIDVVARELLSGYQRSYNFSKHLLKRLFMHGSWNRAVVETFLRIGATEIDTVIALKHGLQMALFVKNLMEELVDLAESAPGDSWVSILSEVDSEFKTRGLNPGSIADITVSTIAFALLSQSDLNLSSKATLPRG